MIRARALVWIALAAVVFTSTAVLFARGMPIETNLIALLPDAKRSPAVEHAETKLGEAAARRVVFLIGASSAESARSLAQSFEQTVAGSGAFKDVRATFPAPSLAALRDIYFPRRFNLISEADQSALTAAASGGPFIEDRLQRRLHDPFRPTLGVPLQRDPLGVFDNYLTDLPYAKLSGALEFADGALLAVDGSRTYAVVLAELAGSPHSSDVQKRMTAALAAASERLRAIEPQVTLLRAGVVHYAAAARESAEREMDRIGTGSIIGIAILLLLVFRAVRPLLLGLVSVATGICAATLVTVLAFDQIHVITLVFGASLLGEAVDYSIQYFAARLDAAGTWNAERGLRAVLPGLTIALLTSVLGYAALALAPFPALRQIALFSIVGLAVAYLTVALLIPTFAQSPAKYQPQAMLHAAAAWWTRAESFRGARVRAAVALVLGAICAPGLFQLTAADDVRLLISPPADLAAEEASIRRLTGFSQSGQYFVIEGGSAQEVLEREEALTARLRELVRARAITNYQAVSDFVPSDKRQRATYALWQQHVFAPTAGLHQALARNGFRQEVAAQYAAEFRASADRRLAIDEWLASPTSVPFRHLWIGDIADSHASVVMPAGFTSVGVLQAAAEGLPGIALVDKAGEVSRLFREFRRSGSVVLFLAALVVYAVLAWRYGARQAGWAMTPTVLAMTMTLAYFGYTGAPLTLFNVMALLLVLGVGVNYVIFLYEGGERRGAVLIGVLLSALTTLLSFGLLAWSATPALGQFGATLFVGITVTTLLSPVFGPRRHKLAA